MGNKCCHGSDEVSSSLYVVDTRNNDHQPSTLVTTPNGGLKANDISVRTTSAATVTMRVTSEPQRKMAEYLRIVRQAQAENLAEMREQLKKKPDLFVLNNLILSIQFFENFER